MAISKRVRFEILRRDNHTCQYCGRAAPEVKLTIDHVVPQALGGSDKPENLTAACSECNAGKTSIAPDSPLVTKVDADAVRWSRAMTTAAQRMLADRTAMQLRHREFLDAWNNWKTHGGKGSILPLPTNWQHSIERFLIAGLPMPVLLDCLHKSMSAEKVESDGKFKYMCGIAWKLIDELQEQARSIASSEEAEKPPVHPAVAEFARELLHDAGFDEETGEYAEALTWLREMYDDVPEGDDFDVAMARSAFEWLGSEHNRMMYACDRLREQVPPKLLEDTKEPLLDFLRANLGENYSTATFESEFLRVIEGFFAARYLGGLPETERGGWLDWAEQRTPQDYPFWFAMVTAADCARRVKQGRVPERGSCFARSAHGALCPLPAFYEFEAASCPWSGESSCGHTHDGLCAEHVERAVEGATQWLNGDIIELRDFREADRSNPWKTPF